VLRAGRGGVSLENAHGTNGERIILSQCDAQGKGGKTVVTRRAGNEPGVWKHRLCHRFCVAKPATLAMGLIEDAND